MCHTEYLIHQLFLGQVGNELSGGGGGAEVPGSHGRESIFPLEGSKLGRDKRDKRECISLFYVPGYIPVSPSL